MKPLEAIRCTHPNCLCECFSPGKSCLRHCETCKHGWVSHALDKLGYAHLFNLGMQVEVVQPNIVFDIASLMLYGAQATPIRLKILLDRLFSVLQHDEVLQVLNGFGWTYEDYARGYILQVGQDSNGRVLDKWTIASREEEHIILQQFLRFGETKAIAQEIILQDTKEKQDLYIKQTTRAESEIKKFIERSNLSTTQGLIRPYEARPLFAGRLPLLPPGSRLLTPPLLQASYSPTRDIRPLGMPTSNATSTSVSPLGRLQTMQPFEFRRDQTSPDPSPNSVDKPAASSSPSSDSPKNLCSTPTSVHSAPSPIMSQRNLDSSENAAVPGGICVMDDDDQSLGAIDYSTKEDPASPDYDSKAKHLRKSNHPIKRQWTPSAGFGQTFIGPNGKKRVLCTACNKTFCDKGALKIHYSAVHLKEMHKCTVDGCNMMFSSRRSRNRHSANPNPKLHMATKRKDMSDSPRPYDDAKSVRMINSPPTMVVPPSLLPRGTLPGVDAQGLMRADPAFFVDMNNQFAYIHAPDKRPRLDTDDTSDDNHDEPKDLSNHIVEEGEPLDEESKQELNVQRGGSRRKSNAPTRCAQNDEMYVMSDDNSDDKDPSNGKSLSGRGRRISCKDGKSESDRHHQDSCIKSEPKDEVQQEDGEKNEDMGCGNGIHCGPEDKLQSDQDLKEQISRKRNSINFPKIASLLTNSSHQNNNNNSSIASDDSFQNHSASIHEASPCSSPCRSDQDSEDSCIDSNTNGHLIDDLEIPIDKTNPRKCLTCGKMFQNQFGVKIHYRNAHMKLVHPCTVDGCSATFPSKRSRDRHASNLGLHKKLLSSDDHEQDGDSSTNMQSLRENVLQSLYGPDFIENETCGRNGHLSPSASGSAGSDCNSDDEPEEDEIHLNGHAGSDDSSDASVSCHLCESKFRDNLALKEHFENIHPKEMFQCTINGCEKIFSTRKSRNRHSQNDGLHRHLPMGKKNGVS
ncbi:zinc finger protein basonuclin-2-like isoform X1 [Haliotis cracherodii]|uniref:zinc finger protein basonuclin-2-like isoform X1 n=1 Tax=Haliotis cracherodii TaxID=6455 RepID=UPI0039ED61E6